MRVVSPPRDENKLHEQGQRIFEAGRKLGMNLDLQGFLYAWVGGGTRVIIDEQGDEIVGLALMAVGKRWANNDVAATILQLIGDRPKLLDFAKQIAIGAGCSALYIEWDAPNPPEGIRHQVVEILLED